MGHPEAMSLGRSAGSGLLLGPHGPTRISAALLALASASCGVTREEASGADASAPAGDASSDASPAGDASSDGSVSDAASGDQDAEVQLDAACGPSSTADDGPPLILREHAGSFLSVAANRQFVFTVESDVSSACVTVGSPPPNLTLSRQPRDGGPAEVLLPNPPSGKLLATERYLFVGSDRLNLETGQIEPTDCGDGARVGDDLVLSCGRGIVRFAGGGGEGEVLRPDRLESLTVAGDYLYGLATTGIVALQLGSAPERIGDLSPAGYYPPQHDLLATCEGVAVQRREGIVQLDPRGNEIRAFDGSLDHQGDDWVGYWMDGSLLRWRAGAAEPEVLLPVGPLVMPPYGPRGQCVLQGRLFCASGGVLTSMAPKPARRWSPSGTEPIVPAFVDMQQGIAGRSVVPGPDDTVVVSTTSSLSRLGTNGELWTIAEGGFGVLADDVGPFLLGSDTLGAYWIVAVDWDGAVRWRMDLPGAASLGIGPEGLVAAGTRAGDAGPASTVWWMDVDRAGAVVRSGEIANLTAPSGNAVSPSHTALAGSTRLLAGTAYRGDRICSTEEYPRWPHGAAAWAHAAALDGATRWQRWFPGAALADAVLLDDGSSLLVLAVRTAVDLGDESWTVPFPPDAHGLLVRMDSSGAILWKQPLPTPGEIELAPAGAETLIVLVGMAGEYFPLAVGDTIATSPYVAALGLDGSVRRVSTPDDASMFVHLAVGYGQVLVGRSASIQRYGLADVVP